MDNNKKKLLDLINNTKTLSHLVYVVDDSDTEKEFRMLVAEMIKIKSSKPNFIFYVETGDQNHYNYLREKVFNWSGSSSVLPQVEKELEFKINKMAKSVVCIKCEVRDKERKLATEESFIIKYEK